MNNFLSARSTGWTDG